MAAKLEASGFRADIEGLRAVAVLGVLAFHSGVPHLGGGYVGVDVFYVISGYLITSLMLRDTEPERPTLGSFLSGFYARRARRILPAACLVAMTTLLGASLLQNPIENANVGGDATWTTLFVSNVRFASQASDYFAAGNAPSPFLQYWSLSLEEQFYVVWPVVFFALLALATRLRRRGLLVSALIAIVIASFALSVAWMRDDAVRAFYLLPPRAWELGIGAVLAFYSGRLSSLSSSTRTAAMALGLVAILGSMLLFTASTPFPGWTALPPTLGTAAVIAGGCATPAGGAVYRLLALRPIQLIGKYSFSLYLWHWPALVLKIEHVKWIYASWTTRTAFMVLASLPAAALTYHLVENPIRRARSLRASAPRSLVFGLSLIVVSLGGIWLFENYGSNARLSTDRRVAETHGRLAREIVPRDFVPANMVPALAETGDRTYTHCGSPCIVGAPKAAHKIVVFGNSHAAHWGGAFEGAATSIDADIEIHSPGGCTSFLIPVELLPHTNKTDCEARRIRVFDGIVNSPPELVVLSNMSLDPFATNPTEWERGVRDAIRRVPKSTTVLVFAETPRGPESMPLCLVRNLEHADRCDQHWPDEINARLEHVVKEEGAVFVDLRPLFCIRARCPAITEDMLIYADGDHLTVPYSRARAEWIAEVLQRALAERHRAPLSACTN